MNFSNGIQAIVIVLWISVVGLIALTVIRSSRGIKNRGLITTTIVLFILSLVMSTVSAGLVFIQPDERGVVISAVAPLGYRQGSLEPGLRWVIPFLEEVKRYSISRQTYTLSNMESQFSNVGDTSIAARTSDGQEIFVDASLIYSIDPDKVIPLHIMWQSRYVDSLVRPLARGVIRDIVSQYGVEEVVTTMRSDMTDEIEKNLSLKFADNGLLMVDFVLRNITFSPEYAASVEQKQIAEQQAKQAELVVEQKKQEAEQARQTAQGQADAIEILAEGEATARVTMAEAEAEALRMIAKALEENPDLLTYQYITKLAPGIQVMLVPNNAPYLLPLPELVPGVTP